ncbi:MAG TPA: TRAP transporter small permease subunit [Candidatus Competibacter sp.]|nr:C4-dicarboxylate ABC transporter [Candidatus Competibacteraceae bacterium]HRC72196.1 TRAP transporter small permease subunit [Candidatus Competibacter sp.]
MRFLLRLSAAIDALNRAIGRWMTWLILLCALASALAATLRYGFDWGSNALLEVQWFMFGLVFLFCASWTLQAGGHVRIDILYSRLRPTTQLWIDILGGLLFLLPVCLLIAYDSWNFFLIAYQTREASPNPGGLAWWPMKLAIPVAFVLLSLQGVSEIIKSAAALTGHREMPEFRGGH